MRLVRTIAVLCAGLVLFSCGDSSQTDGGITLCDNNDDCDLGQFCHDGICTEVPDGGECTRDLDCSPGETCVNGICVPGQTDGGDGADGGDLGPPIPDIQAEPENGQSEQKRSVFTENSHSVHIAFTGAAYILLK